MADTAITITPGSGANVDTRTEATNGNHRQVIVIGDPSTNAGVAPVDVTNGLAVQIIPAIPSGNNVIGRVGGMTAVVSANFTRPADTNAYALGDLVANDTTAASVTPMSFAVARATGLGAMMRRARVRKTGTATASALFRLHLYTATPTVTNGDNGAWLSDNGANYLGAFDITVDKAFSDGAAGNGAPLIGSEINTVADTVYGLLEARAAYTPGSAEVFTITLEVLQN